MSAESSEISGELAQELERFEKLRQDECAFFLKNFDEIIKQVDEAAQNEDHKKLRELAYKYLNLAPGEFYSVNTPDCNRSSIFKFKPSSMIPALTLLHHLMIDSAKRGCERDFDVGNPFDDIKARMKEYLIRVQKELSHVVVRYNLTIEIKTDGVPHCHEVSGNKLSPSHVVRIYYGGGLLFLLKFLLKEVIGEKIHLSKYDSDFGFYRTMGLKVVVGNNHLSSYSKEKLLGEARTGSANSFDYPVIFSAEIEAQYLLEAAGPYYWLSGPKGEGWVLPFNFIDRLKNVNLTMATQCFEGSERSFVDLPSLDVQMKVYNLLKNAQSNDPLSFLADLDPKYTKIFSEYLISQKHQEDTLQPVVIPSPSVVASTSSVVAAIPVVPNSVPFQVQSDTRSSSFQSLLLSIPRITYGQESIQSNPNSSPLHSPTANGEGSIAPCPSPSFDFPEIPEIGHLPCPPPLIFSQESIRSSTPTHSDTSKDKQDNANPFLLLLTIEDGTTTLAPLPSLPGPFSDELEEPTIGSLRWPTVVPQYLARDLKRNLSDENLRSAALSDHDTNKGNKSSSSTSEIDTNKNHNSSSGHETKKHKSKK